MSVPMIYLSGPITGLSFEGANDWRADADTWLQPYRTLNPLRGKETHERRIVDCFAPSESDPWLSAKGITMRDHFDVRRSTVVLANLLDARTVSVGTVVEIAWADAHKIPVVCAIENTGNPHDHLMLMHMVGMRTNDLHRACQLVKKLLEG